MPIGRYLLIVLLLSAVVPAVAVAFDLSRGMPFWTAVGQEFVFWACGVRLFTAGIKQVTSPDFTARRIFGIADPAAGRLVAEIGAGNLAIGGLCLLTWFKPGWVVPAAIAAFVFYLLALFHHLRNSGRKAEENVALAGDAIVSLALAAFLVATLAGAT